MAIKRVQIYDMDGTIVCSLHRYRTIDGLRIDLDYWRENQSKAMGDSLLPLATQYQADLSDPECFVIIATARVMGDNDYRFVREILGNPDYLISRKDGDTTSGGILKIKGLQKFFNLKNFVPHQNDDDCARAREASENHCRQAEDVLPPVEGRGQEGALVLRGSRRGRVVRA